jgi:DNA polymerase I-like protein with 3'-5' exonuclease and polymerase domains
MPFKDPEAKKEYMRQWRKEATESGYGKVLYGRRRVRFENENRYRNAITAAVKLLTQNEPSKARALLMDAIIAADKAARDQAKAEQLARPKK